MKILKGCEKKYKDWLAKNQDAYGNACFRYAEHWAELMEADINSNSTDDDIMAYMIQNANRLSHEADTEGITGFMYGCAVNILSQCWEYGEYLRRWHNNEYNYNGDGVVNPAVLGIKTKN